MPDQSRPSRPEDVLIEAVLEARRLAGDVYEFGPFRLDVPDRRVTRDGVVIFLPPKEFDTLHYLVEARGRLVTKAQLLRRVWGDVNVEEGTVAQRICALRKALGRDEDGREYIETVPRAGYRLQACCSDDPGQ